LHHHKSRSKNPKKSDDNRGSDKTDLCRAAKETPVA
jgi:hypothetical protein